MGPQSVEFIIRFSFADFIEIGPLFSSDAVKKPEAFVLIQIDEFFKNYLT